MSVNVNVNGEARELDVAPETPLLWALRDQAKLKGTKFGCGVGVCGACTVMVDGIAVRSCTVPVGDVAGSEITTIEGLSDDGSHPVQAAWIAEQVPQCGYCQPGMIMAVTAMIRDNPGMDDEGIRDQLTNVCRCGTYPRIVKAIRRAMSDSAAA